MKEAPDPELTKEQLLIIQNLSETELNEIDEMLISGATERNRKVARIVGSAMMNLDGRVEGIPDVFYAQRIKKLVNEGRLIAEGNLDYMRYSEVRLP